MISFLWRSNSSGSTTRWATPVSSSTVMKQTTPVPGLWRTSTTPATTAAAPSLRAARSAQRRTRAFAKPGRRNPMGWPFSDSRVVW